MADSVFSPACDGKGERTLWPPRLICRRFPAQPENPVLEALSELGMDTCTCPSLNPLLEGTLADVDLVVVSDPKPAEVSFISQVMARHPWLCALIVEENPVHPVHPSVPQRTWVLHINDPDPGLVARVFSICLTACRFRVLHLAQRILRASPMLFRQAVRTLLRAKPLEEDLSGEGLVGSISELAVRCRCRRETLSRTQAATGIQLSGLIDWCRIGHAIQIRHTQCAPWDVVAWRCGYDSHAGLFSLAQRTYGRPLEDLVEIPAWEPVEFLLEILAAGRSKPDHGQ